MNEKEIAAKLRRLEEENINLKNWNRQLESELSAKRDEAKELKETLNRAKDIRPWQRPNFRNVKQMAKRAFLDVVKVAGGWVVKMGSRIGKKFKTLRDIWLILTREEWNLHDEFIPYEEVEQQVEAVEQPPIPTPQSPHPTPQSPHPTPQSPHPTPQLTDDTPIGSLGTLGKLRSEWRLFPTGRAAIAEALAKVGIDLALVTGAT